MISSTEYARLTERVRGLEEALRSRVSDLEAADRHIAQLEEKLLALKDAKRALKQLEREKQALRKSPEQKIGQVLLAPFRLLQKMGGQGSVHLAASEYQLWLERHRAPADQLAAMREEVRSFESAPLISIITPVFNTPAPWLRASVESVLMQAYENWELILIDDGSTDAQTLKALTDLAGRDRRIRLTRLEKNSGISAASNRGLTSASGEWIAILDHDDVLEPDALFCMAKLLQREPAADLIYSDEDKLTEAGPEAPIFKPDWSPDFFLSYNYIAHLAVLRRRLVDEVGGFRAEFDGAQDYDLFLRMIEKTDRIHHIPRVLYHWRRGPSSTSENIRRKPNALEAGRKAIEQHLQRRGESGYVVVDWPTQAYRVKRELPRPQKICIIVLSRAGHDSLARCTESIEKKTRYSDHEIVVVRQESGSNCSALNNQAAAQSDAPWLLFLESEVETIESDWLHVMAEHVQRPEVGAVGARLLSPSETVEDAGLVLGVEGIAHPAFRGFPAEHPGVCRQLQVTRNCSAVSGACLLTRREVFEEVGGFDEAKLPDIFANVDLCLKMRRAGYRIVYTPFAKLRLHSSVADDDEGASRVMRARWPEWLARDPFYNPNLSRARADFSLGV